MSNQNENEELPGMLALAKGVQEGAWPHTMDAQVWAQKWLEITKDKPEVATDEGAMIGWFANAIMAGYDAAMLRSNAELTGGAYEVWEYHGPIKKEYLSRRPG